MRNEPTTYTPTESVQVSSSDSPMAQADLQRGQEVDQFAKQMSGLVQGEVDQKEASQSVKDAQQKGLAWTPKSNLTEGGRAYNQAGQQIATNIGTANLLAGMNQIYTNQINQPAGQGNLDSLQKNLNTYYQTQMQNVSPKLQPALSQAYKTAYLSDSNQIAQREAKYNRAQSIATLDDTAQNLSKEAAKQIGYAQQTLDPIQQSLYTKSSHELLIRSHLANQHSAAISGNFNNAATANRNSKIDYIRALAFGQQKGLVNLIQNTTDNAQRQKYIDQLHQMPENFMNDPGVKSIMGNISANDAMSSNEQYRLSRELSRNTNNIMNGIQASRAQLSLIGNNALTAASQGKVISPKDEAQLQLNANYYASWQPKYMAALSSHSLLDNLQSQTRDQQIAWYNQYGNGQNPITVHGLDATATAKVQKNVAVQLKKTIALENKDPAAYAQGSPQFNNYLKQTVPTMGDSQTEVTHVLANPFENFKTARTAQGKQYLDHVYDQLRMIQHTKGIPNESILSNQQASSIADQLNTEDPAQRIQSLQMAKNNYGANWGLVQKSLINTKKIPYSDFIALQLSNSGRAGNAPSEMIQASDAIREQGNKYWETLGTTNATAIKDVMADPTFASALSSFQQYPGTQSTQAIKSLAQSIANVASTRILKNGNNWIDGSDTMSQSVTDVIGSMYQKSAAESIRVPYSVNVKDSQGNITKQPVDYDTVKDIMTYMKKDADKLGAVSYNGRISSHSATWKNTPDGSGMVMVDGNGHPFYNKNKQPFGFSFTEAANPGSIPGFEHYKRFEFWGIDNYA